MSDIVKTGSEEVALLGLPTFERFEEIAETLAVIRQDAAQAREPTAELLERLDQAIHVAATGAGEVRTAAAPAGKVDVANYLALFGKSFLNSKPQDVRIFAQVMLGDVMSLQPSIGAIEIACRRWRRRVRFMPEIAELLAELKDTVSEVGNTVEFISRLPALRDRMVRELEKS